MSNNTSNEQLELLVIQYLYGDMDAEERRRFEQQAADDAQLRQLLEQEQRLNSAIPLGTQPVIDEDRVQGNRWLLRQKLQREARPNFPRRSLYGNCLNDPWWWHFRARPWP